MIPTQAVEAATKALIKAWGYEATWDEGTSADVRIALEAAAPLLLAEAWQSAYDLGVDDERTSQANPGIAGCFCYKFPCECFISPARANPYGPAK